MKYLILILFITNLSFSQTEPKLIIRNVPSIKKYEEPLYIVDGKPSNIEEVRNLNPENIESMTVLKDSAANFFCHRFTNGVIIIKTKKLSKREFRKMKQKKLQNATNN